MTTAWGNRERLTSQLREVSVFVSFSGVGFSFIFSWVLMGIVTTLFVVSGNVEKLLCEPLANRQLFKVPNVNLLLNSLLPPLCVSWPGSCHSTTQALCP